MIRSARKFFAAHMILSGLSQQASKLDREKMQTQLQSVTAILETAQRDFENSTFAFYDLLNWNKRV